MTAQAVVLQEVERQALTTLADLAASKRAFEHARARGWVPGPVVKEVVGRMNAGWRFPRLRKLGFITSERIADAGRPRNAIVLWRITQEGEDEIARLEGRPARHIAPPRPHPDDQHHIYITARSWSLLATLQGRDGFVPWRDVQYTRLARRRTRVWMEDLTLLLNRGFVARENRGSRTRPEIWVAATATGRQVRPSDLKSSKSLVKIRVGCPERVE